MRDRETSLSTQAKFKISSEKLGGSGQEQANAKSLEKQGSPQKCFLIGWIPCGRIMAVRGKAEYSREERDSDNRSMSRMCKGKVKRIVCQKGRIRETT